MSSKISSQVGSSRDIQQGYSMYFDGNQYIDIGDISQNVKSVVA